MSYEIHYRNRLIFANFAVFVCLLYKMFVKLTQTIVIQRKKFCPIDKIIFCHNYEIHWIKKVVLIKQICCCSAYPATLAFPCPKLHLCSFPRYTPVHSSYTSSTLTLVITPSICYTANLSRPSVYITISSYRYSKPL